MRRWYTPQRATHSGSLWPWHVLQVYGSVRKQTEHAFLRYQSPNNAIGYCMVGCLTTLTGLGLIMYTDVIFVWFFLVASMMVFALLGFYFCFKAHKAAKWVQEASNVENETYAALAEAIADSPYELVVNVYNND